MTEETQSGEIRADCFGYARNERGIVSDNARDKQRCRALNDFYNEKEQTCTGCTFYKTSVQYVEDQNRADASRARRGIKTQKDCEAAYKNAKRETAEVNNAEMQNAEPAVIENEPNEQRIDLDNAPKPSGTRKRLTKAFLRARFAEQAAEGRFFENADDIPRVDELTAMRVWEKIKAGQTAKITGTEALTYHVILKRRKLRDRNNEAIDAAFGEIQDRAERLFEIIPHKGDYGERRAILELYYMKCYTSVEVGGMIGMKPAETYSYIVHTLERLIEEARTWITEN